MLPTCWLDPAANFCVVGLDRVPVDQPHRRTIAKEWRQSAANLALRAECPIPLCRGEFTLPLAMPLRSENRMRLLKYVRGHYLR
ncbi:MAG: hypothetical protein DME38_06325 [Verrucomicrobia bacterium]|nr:MAG: hypothetical protein DME38_06325 [Verrucomicrobiota bacterium]